MTCSPFFQVLHDETKPTGSLGNGTHYSVVRTVLPVWSLNDNDSDEENVVFSGARRAKLELHDFAIIWDEDHDERIWGVIQHLHAGGLLAPVRFIGERKGSITVLCAPDAGYDGSNGGFKRYQELVARAVAADAGDSWDLEVFKLGEDGQTRIINDRREKVTAYLEGLAALWTLGPAPWRMPKRQPSESRPPSSLFSQSKAEPDLAAENRLPMTQSLFTQTKAEVDLAAKNHPPKTQSLFSRRNP